MGEYPKGVRNKVAFGLGTLLDDAFFPGSVAARHAQRGLPHVRELNSWVDDITQRTGKKVPYFDPRCGGRNARVLLLQQDPSEVAQKGSRMISRDNNDRTANNTSTICDLVGLGYEEIVPWNVVPWWVRDPDLFVGGRPRTITAEAVLASKYVLEVLELLPGVEKVVLLGKAAQTAWDRAIGTTSPRGVQVKRCPHTSPLAHNQAHNRQESEAAFAWAAER